ncbi:hypothetical protein THAOC_12805 [Thalassiosira oceanica]|uniref:Uncharacterized protein n=1 Tax=Thalassiosira oceanica TaxID=159749 RepID=K0SMR7_THAOC|nr:hypothetical protein THAOC_12805 [Thalassiosira oceanica]|eukprot:EJK66284.1 hypothetical protein THAOC_12805 [Thalassiosira oceanica]
MAPRPSPTSRCPRFCAHSAFCGAQTRLRAQNPRRPRRTPKATIQTRTEGVERRQSSSLPALRFVPPASGGDVAMRLAGLGEFASGISPSQSFPVAWVFNVSVLSSQNHCWKWKGAAARKGNKQHGDDELARLAAAAGRQNPGRPPLRGGRGRRGAQGETDARRRRAARRGDSGPRIRPLRQPRRGAAERGAADRRGLRLRGLPGAAGRRRAPDRREGGQRRVLRLRRPGRTAPARGTAGHRGGCISQLPVAEERDHTRDRKRAFSGCTALRRVALPSTVAELGEYAFYGCCSLAEMRFNEGLRVVGENAFKICTSLRSVTIPSTVTELGNFAFSQCCNLSEMIFLGGSRLLRQDVLENLPSEGGILNQQNINDMIGRDAFFGCSLKTVKISTSWALLGRMERLPPECGASVMERIRGLPCLELTQDGDILACFPVLGRALANESAIRANLATARSLCQAIQMIALHEIKESIILFELAMWKSGIGGDTVGIDSRVPIPDPAKSLIIEYCCFAGLLEPTIEGS